MTLPIIEELLANAESFILALGLLIATFFFARVAMTWVERSLEKTVKDLETRQLLSTLTRSTVIVLGILVALDQIPGVDITSFLAGLGILGFTIGFALQDIARNFIAGILLLVRQPFDIGDAVEVAGHAGTVMEINVRDTVIKTWDGVMEILPNMDVYASPIVNYSELSDRRRTVMIGLGYGQDVERAKEVFLEAMRGVDGVLADPAPEILAEELGDSSLTLAARFWVNQVSHNLFGVHSEVVEAIDRAAEREGLDLPYPIQTVRLAGESTAEAS